MKRRTPMRRMSKKREAEMKEYLKLRRFFMVENPFCQVCFARGSKDVHHVKGRGRNLNKTETWRAVCRSCHNWIHNHGKQARELGLLA